MMQLYKTTQSYSQLQRKMKERILLLTWTQIKVRFTYIPEYSSNQILLLFYYLQFCNVGCFLSTTFCVLPTEKCIYFKQSNSVRESFCLSYNNLLFSSIGEQSLKTGKKVHIVSRTDFVHHIIASTKFCVLPLSSVIRCGKVSVFYTTTF